MNACCGHGNTVEAYVQFRQGETLRGDKAREWQEKFKTLKDTAIHDWFGLSYASYLVLPRVLMQEMPKEWQEKMVSLLEEGQRTWDYEDDYQVRLRGDDGRYKRDPLREYRRPNRDLIEAARRRP